MKAPTFKQKKSKLPTVTIITTGGTITSRVDYRTGAVHSLSKPEELLASIPELAKLANIKVLNPFNVMSEDMTHKEWVKLAQLVAKDNSEGVIITHGTDTLHFTSAALSFMLKVNKPIALVGGQRSSDRGSFDGAQNLICAVHYCLSDIAEVAVVMHESSEDKSCIAIRGTKARKMHTSRRDAFRPINDLPIARISPEGEIKLFTQAYNKRSKAKTKAETKFEPKIALVKFAPGLSPEIIDFYVKKKYKGIILEGTGLGHVSVKTWLKAIKAAAKKMFVGMTSQCLYGRVDPYVYTNLRKINEAGAVYLEDMLPETAYVKLGYCLANKKSMQDNLVGEISKRIPKKAYLC